MPLVGFDEDDVFQVDMLQDKRVSRYRKTENISYLVKWHGYGMEHNTWEPAENILDSDLIKAFETKNIFLRRFLLDQDFGHEIPKTQNLPEPSARDTESQKGGV